MLIFGPVQKVTTMAKPIILSSDTLVNIANNSQTAFAQPLSPQPIDNDGEIYWVRKEGERAFYADEVGKLRIDDDQLPFTKGDLLWCKETWAWRYEEQGIACFRRNARDSEGEICMEFLPGDPDKAVKWEIPAKMPEDVAQLFIEIRSQTVLRVQDMTDTMLQAQAMPMHRNGNPLDYDARYGLFAEQWNDQHGGKREELKWDANPYVLYVNFRRFL